MENPYKRFGAWVTDLKSDLFIWARIKLTALYLLVIAVILIVFSIVIFSDLTYSIRRNIDRRNDATYNPAEETFIEDATESAKASIIIIDACIYIIVGGASYVLAGYTLKPIRKTLEDQEQFSAEASHELRTPLAVMRTDIEVLLRSKQSMPEDVKKVLSSNLEEIGDMSKMAEQLLEISRGQYSKKSQMEILDISQPIKKAAEKLSVIAAKKNIDFQIEKLESLQIKGVRENLERMAKNIIANAINYTPEGGSVAIAVALENNQAKFTVKDTGIGIAENDLPHIFKRFYKADSARTGTENGSGLGLAIVEQIVKKHRGKIKIQSSPNLGTTVSVFIPVV